MSDIIPAFKLGDISFGIPADIDFLHRPWGFYTFLGVTPQATQDEIKAAYKTLVLKLHPDQGGDVEMFKHLGLVYTTLSDDGGVLGPEHGLRHQYDQVATLESVFDGLITYKGDRTQKFSEVMLIRMQIEHEKAKAMQRLREFSPQVVELESRLKTDSPSAHKEILERIREISLDMHPIPPQQRAEFLQDLHSDAQKHLQEQLKLAQDAFRNLGEFKVVDVNHLGTGSIAFGTEAYRSKIHLVGVQVQGGVLRLFLDGDSYFVGVPQVHVKSLRAPVTVTDPSLVGIVNLVAGDVRLEYDKSSYGEVIRVRGDHVEALGGFVNKGDLYVPQGFASQNWWKKKPALDVAVKTGSVVLRLKSLNVSDGNFSYNSLESMITTPNLYKKISQIGTGRFSNKYFNK